jgi:predicted O-methyltransferase YrrM
MSKDLLAKGGTIVFDNSLMAGHAYNPESTNKIGLEIRKCNEYLKSRDDIFRVSKTVNLVYAKFILV